MNNVVAEVHSFALPQPEPEEEAPSHHDPPDLGSSCHDDDEAFGGVAGAAVGGPRGLELEIALGAFGGVAGAAMRCGCGSTPRAATAGGAVIGFAAAGAALAVCSSCDATVPRGRSKMPGGGGVGGCRGTPSATDLFCSASSEASPAKWSKASANTLQAFACRSSWATSAFVAIASSEHKAELTTSTAFPTASRNSLFRFSSTVEA